MTPLTRTPLEGGRLAAREALDDYARQAWGYRLAQLHPDDLPSVLGDLLADLHHWADSEGVLWDAATRMGEMHHYAEATRGGDPTAAVGKGTP